MNAPDAALTTRNTAIVVDSTADLSDARERFANWRVVPLYVNFEGESRRDGVELSTDELYRRIAAGAEPPTTSQPTPADFAAVYGELVPAYERVLSLHLARKLSGTIASAEAAAAETGGAVRTIDTGTVSAAIAILGFAIQRRLERGTTEAELDALVERFRRESGLLFTLETLEYLARGGRIGRASAFLGGLLSVKPILTIRDGEVVPISRVRGLGRAIDEFRERLEAASADAPSLRIGFAHAAAAEWLDALREQVAKARPQATVEIVTALGAVVGAHAGPGTLGLFWFDDPE
jgi:DegV family protein with EDD domain